MSLTYTPINELPFAPNFEGNDYLLIWDVSQPANQARRLTFTALASYLAYTNRRLDWEDITNKPDIFPPAVHSHVPADIVGLDFLGEQIGAIRCTRQRFTYSGFVGMPSNQSLYFAPAWDSLWAGLFLESFDYQILAFTSAWDANNYQALSIGGVSLNGSFFNISPQLPLVAIADFEQRREKLAIDTATYFGNVSNTANRLISLNFVPVGQINGLLQFTFFYRGILA